MKHYVIFILTLVGYTASAQNLVKAAKEIEDEGKLLYRLERSSWIATDLFTRDFKNTAEKGGSYLTYQSGDQVKTIFYTSDNPPQVTVQISFDEASQNVRIDTPKRPFTADELTLFQMKNEAREIVARDTFFRHYKNTTYNLVPIIGDDAWKVYALTGHHVDSLILFGNDYLLTFSKKLSLKHKQRFHNNLIPIDYRIPETDTVNSDVSWHDHSPVSSPFITATDICTLMLYQGVMECQSHIVYSPTHVSLWDCKKNHLLIFTTEVWNRLYRK